MAEREKSSLQHVIESERQAEHEKVRMHSRRGEWWCGIAIKL